MIGPRGRVSIKYLIYTCGAGILSYALVSPFLDSNLKDARDTYGKDVTYVNKTKQTSEHQKQVNQALRRAAGLPENPETKKRN